MRRLTGLRGIFGVFLALGGGVACNEVIGNRPVLLDEEVGLPPRESRTEISPTEPDGGACEADLRTDAKNCGRCGHDCLRGTCSEGRCAAFDVATDQPGAENLTYDPASDALFFTTNGGEIRSCPRAGCGASATVLTRLDAGNPVMYGLAVHNGTVYAAGYYASAIVACPTTGCAAPVTIASVPFPRYVAYDGTNLFFASAAQAFVGRCSLPDCAGGPKVIAGDGKPAYTGIVEDGDSVYWFGGGPTQQFDKAIVYRAPKTANDAGVQVVASDLAMLSQASGVAARDGFVYVGTTTGIVRVPAAGGAPVAFAVTPSPVTSVAVDERNVYWAEASSTAIKACSTADACASGPELLHLAGYSATALIVTSHALYWADPTGGVIRGIAK